MASVDLEDLIEDLQSELNTPGADVYDTVSTTAWVSYLRNAFWSAHLDGLMEGWTESDGLISKLNDPTADAMSRDQQQLIIMYAGINILRNELKNLNTVFRAKAGSVEYETQKSSQVLKGLLEDMTQRRNYILQRLADTGVARDMVYIDSYIARQNAINNNYIDWVGA